jgi:hypothetical protein
MTKTALADPEEPDDRSGKSGKGLAVRAVAVVCIGMRSANGGSRL